MNPDGYLIMIPTYNEAENLDVLITKINHAVPGVSILFVDDNSPDGTGEILEKRAGSEPNLNVIRRSGKLGVGSAHKDGVQWAYDNGFEILITMDADGSHSPADIPRFIEAGGTADVVVGTRFLEEKSLNEWALKRKILTHTGHFLTKVLLRLPFDATGAFRLYNLNQLPTGLFGTVESDGYSFFYESLHRINLSKISIEEISVTLPARTYGNSKMRLSDLIQGITFLLRLSLLTMFQKRKLIVGATLSDERQKHGPIDTPN